MFCSCLLRWGAACEFMDHDVMRASNANLGLANPVGADYPFYVLIETQGSNERSALALFLTKG